MNGLIARLLGPLGTYLAGGLFLASLAGVLWLWLGPLKTAERERDDTTAWASSACLSVGQAYAPKDGRGARKTWGAACAAEIARLVKFERDTNAATSQALNEQVQEDAVKTEAHVAAVTRNTASVRKAIARVEKANAEIEGDRAGPEFWSALNDLGGLSDSPEIPVRPLSGGGEGEVQPAGGPAPVLVAAGGLP